MPRKRLPGAIMKKSVVILLVLVAVIVLVSPGIVGRIAENNMDASLRWAESERPGMLISTESFERGWFTSAGQHRVEFDDASLKELMREFVAGGDSSATPAVVINTRVDHGLVPVTSLARDAGTLVPELASAVSTFRLDPGNGELIELPGSLYTDFTLTGASVSRLKLEKGNFAGTDGTLSWQGADVEFTTRLATGAVAIRGSIDPFEFGSDEVTMRFGRIDIDIDQRRSGFGFNVGPGAFTLDGVSINDGAQTMTLGRMSASGDSRIVDERVHGNLAFAMQDIDVPEFGAVSLDIDATMERIDARSLGILIRAMQQAQAADDPEAAFQMLMPGLQPDLQALAAAGAGIHFNRFNISLPQGLVESSLRIDIDETDAGSAFHWPAVLLATKADISLRVPAEVFDLLTAMNPQMGSLIAMGIVQKDGDDYVMDAKYAEGLVNVNGAPMPLPIPGM